VAERSSGEPEAITMGSQIDDDDDMPRPGRRRIPPRRGRNPVVVGAVVGGIVIALAASVWAAVYVIKSRSGDSRLIGTWKSDADATIAELRKSRTVTDKQEAAMRKLFGKMTITYAAKTYTTEFDGKLDTQPYQIVSKDRDSVVLKSWSPIENKEVQFRIRFTDSGTYWVDVESFAISECFRRVK
jgi:hypothetical protein